MTTWKEKKVSSHYQDDKIGFRVKRSCDADAYFLANTQTDALQ